MRSWLCIALCLSCAARRPLSTAPSEPLQVAAPDGGRRIVEAVALGRAISRGTPVPIAQLQAELQETRTGEAAAWALGRSPEGVRPLQDCIERSCPSAVAAARALSGPGAVKAPAPPLATLTAALAGPGPLASEAALSLGILARSGKEKEVATASREALIAALMRPEPAVRAGAAYALGRIPRGSEKEAAAGSRLATALESALRDEDPFVRLLAARAWGKQGLAASGLAGALRDPDWRVRVEGARGLAMLTDAGPLIAAAMPAAVAQLGRGDAREARFAHPLVALIEAAETQGELALQAIPEPARLAAPTPAATATVRCAAARARDRIRKLLADTPACAAGMEPEWRSRLRAGALAAELGP